MSRRNSEKESLLDALVPPPTHPRAGKRILAVSVVAIFILISTMLGVSDTGKAATGLDKLQGRVQGWVYGTDTSDIQGGSRMQRPLDGAGSTEAQEDETVEEGVSNGEVTGEEDADSESESEDTLDATLMHSTTDFAKYLWHRDLEFDVEGNGRLIIVGDVHGMIDELKQFLQELDYSPEQSDTHNDTLVFVGDLVAKHPDIRKSLETVAYIRSLPNAWAVRGNHDQDVINWRNWMTMSESYNALGAEDSAPPDDTPEALKHKWRDEHYRIAKALPQASADWMAERSLTLHIRSLHTYVVHAGLLPWTIPKNDRKKGKHGKGGYKTWEEEQESQSQNTTSAEGEDVTKKQRKRQEQARRQLDEEDEEILASMDFTNSLDLTDEAVAPSSMALLESSTPDIFTPMSNATSASSSPSAAKHDELDPELAILAVPLNRDPYTLLEMRGLLKSGKVTKSNSKGQPWAPIWNRVMQTCRASQSSEVANDESTATIEGTAKPETVDDEKMHKMVHKRKEENRAAIAASVLSKRQVSPAVKKPAHSCRPLSVVYGHAAARGLDIRPYSFGLDSAAVYGRSFSALVVEGAQHVHEANRKASHKLLSLDVVIGDRPAKVYSMKTRKPKEKKH